MALDTQFVYNKTKHSFTSNQVKNQILAFDFIARHRAFKYMKYKRTNLEILKLLIVRRISALQSMYLSKHYFVQHRTPFLLEEN